MQHLDIDMLNTFRYIIHGIDVAHMQQNAFMDDSLFNAIAFAQANDMQQFLSTPEHDIAVNEFVVEIVGQHTIF